MEVFYIGHYPAFSLAVYEVSLSSDPTMVVLSTVFHFLECYILTCDISQFLSILATSIIEWFIHYTQKSFVKQNSICNPFLTFETNTTVDVMCEQDRNNKGIIVN